MLQQELHKAKGKGIIAFSAVITHARKQAVQADTAIVLVKNQKVHI